MNRKSKTIAFILLGLVACEIAFLALRPALVEEWLIWKLGREDDSAWRSAAQELLERRSLRGLPHVAETALARDTEYFGKWEKKFFARYGRAVRLALPGYRRALEHESGEVRLRAINSLRDPMWRNSKTVELLRDVLNNERMGLRWQAAYILGEMGPGAHEAVPALIQALRDPRESVRWAAAWALGRMAPATEEPVPALRDALGDQSILVACQAAEALGDYGPAAGMAVPALVSTFQGNDTLRSYAAFALSRLGRNAREALPDILVALKGEEPWMFRHWVHIHSNWLGREIPKIFGKFSGIHEEPSDGRRHLLLAALEMNAPAEDLLNIGTRLLKAEDQDLREAAALALQQLGSAAAPAVPDLVKALGEKEPPRRWKPFTRYTNQAAVEALVRIGSPAVPPLREALRSEIKSTRIGAALALARIQQESEPARKAIRAALEAEGERDARMALAQALHRVDPAFDAVPMLLQEAQKCTPGVTTRLISDLGNLVGMEARESLPLLLGALREEISGTGWLAARILGRMAREDRVVLLHLLDALGTGSDVARIELIMALGDIPHSPELVVPALVNAVQGEKKEAIRKAAIRSLQRLGDRAGNAVPLLRRLLPRVEGGDLETDVIQALGAICPEDPVVADYHLRRLEEPSVWQSLNPLPPSLLSLDPPPARLAPLFRRALEHHDPLVRIQAARRLWKVEGKTEEIIPLLREALEDDWGWAVFGLPPVFCHSARREAARAASDLGAGAREIAPELTANLDSRDPVLRVLAAGALWKAKGYLYLEVLVQAVEDNDPAGAAIETCRILEAIGPDAREAVPALNKILTTTGEKSLKKAARECLERILEE